MKVVRFENFWPGFSPQHFFLSFLAWALNESVVESGIFSTPELIVESVFSRSLRSRPVGRRSQAKRIWFSGEYVLPPESGVDLSLSFQPTDLTKQNVYFPLCFLSVDWGLDSTLDSPSKEVTRSGVFPTVEEISRERNWEFRRRQRFACAFINNPEPNRMQFIEALRRYGDVDVYGVAGDCGVVRSKAEVASEYRFIVCFENEAQPGYITEKIVDSWALGCVPIWWGLDRDHLLNRNSFLNFSDFENVHDLASVVAEIDRSNARLEGIWREPLAAHTWSLEDAKTLVRQLVVS